MERRERAVLAVTSVSGFMVFLDATVVNVAFPSISASFPDASRADLSWVLSAYSIVFAALLIPGGRIGDLVGRQRTFTIGLVVFVGASALCAVAPTVELLVAARIVQAAGGALVVPTSQALLMAVFPPGRRAAAVGLWSAAAAVAASLGPPLGGVLVQADSWRLVFLINLPIGLAALAGARVLAGSDAPAARPRIDLAGSALVVGAIGSLALAIVQGGEWGWASARILAAFSAAVLLGAALAVWSRRSPAPLVDPALLRIRTFTVASAGTLLLSVALYALLLGGVLFLTTVWRYDVLEAGLAMTPMPVVGAVTAVLGGRLVGRVDQRVVTVPGAACLAAGAIWISAQVGMSADYLAVWLPGMVLAGIGVGLGFATLGTIAVLDLPPDRFGSGSGVTAMTRQLGAVLGIALLVAVVGTPSSAGVLDAFQRGWLVVALAAGCGAAAAAFVTGGRQPTADPLLAALSSGRT